MTTDGVRARRQERAGAVEAGDADRTEHGHGHRHRAQGRPVTDVTVIPLWERLPRGGR